MGDNMILLAFKVLMACLHIFCFFKSFFFTLKKEFLFSSLQTRQIMQETLTKQNKINIAKVAISKNARLNLLYESLRACPSNINHTNRISRSNILKDINDITHDINITIAIAFLAQINCKSKDASDKIIVIR